MKYYRINAQRVSYKEICTGTNRFAAALTWLILRLPIQVPSSCDPPPVEQLEPFRVPKDQIPDSALTKVTSFWPMLRDLGFRGTIFYSIVDHNNTTKYYDATYLHLDGMAAARVRYRIAKITFPTKEYLSCTFLTECNDGTLIVTSNAKPDLNSGPHCLEQFLPNEPCAELWKAHQVRLVSQAQNIRSITKADSLLAMLQRHHDHVRSSLESRRIFEPVEDSEHQPVQASLVEDVPEDCAMVLDEVRRREVKAGMSVWGRIALLAVSMGAFLAAAKVRWSWQFAGLLIPVLLFHELGHFAMMKLFKYRNLNMFFIPFLGAAVSGRSLNVPGWQKTIVSLMGPLPGIFLGSVLGIVAIATGIEWLKQLSLLLIVLNGFNLIPALPFDGGHVLHALLFSRHAILDLVFRVGAVLALFALSLGGDWLMRGIAIAMVISLPAAFKTARISDRLRRQEPLDSSPDGNHLPTTAVVRIMDQLKAEYPKGIPVKQSAQIVRQVYENVMTRPPGWIAALLLGSLYLGGGVATVIMGSILFLASVSDLSQFVADAVVAPKHPVTASQIVDHSLPALEKNSSALTLVAISDSEEAANNLWQDIQTQAAHAPVRLTRWGNDIVLGLTEEQRGQRELWLEIIRRHTERVMVDSQDSHIVLRVQAIAPTKASGKNIEESLQGYFVGNSLAPLVPPWGSDTAIHEDAKLARRTHLLLSQGPPGQDMADSVASYRQIFEARRLGDHERAERLEQEEREQRFAQIDAFHQELAARPANEIDPDVVTLYHSMELLHRQIPLNPGGDSEELPSETTPTEQDPAQVANANKVAELKSAIAKRMQCVEFPDDLTLAVNRIRAVDGWGRANGPVISLEALTFTQVMEGGPALIGWLEKQGCNQIRYEFDLLGLDE